MQSVLKPVLKSFFCLFMGLFLTYFIFSIMTNNWKILPLGILRNFQDVNLFAQQITIMTILIFTSLALSVSSRSGIIDISTPGKLLLGSLILYLVVYFLKGQFWSLFLGILVAYVFLMGLSFLMVFLKFRFNVNEVVFGIMINWIIIFIYQSLTQNGLPWISKFGSVLSFSNLLNFQTKLLHNLSWFIFIALFFVGVIFVFYKWTSIGHQIKIIGNSRSVAKTAGIKTKEISFIAISISSLFICLASAVYVFSKNGGLIPNSIQLTPSEGWTALAISSVSNGNPIGIFFNSFVFSSIETSRSYIGQFSRINPNFLNIVVGILMVTISVMPYLTNVFEKFLSKVRLKTSNWPIRKTLLIFSKKSKKRRQND